MRPPFMPPMLGLTLSAASLPALADPALSIMEGEIEIVGDVVTMELAGSEPGNGLGFHDKIIFTGPVLLTDAPDLKVVLLNDYRPAANTSFDLFDWAGEGGVTGTFDLVLPGDGYEWDTSALYTTGDIVVTVLPVPETETWAMLLAGLGLVGMTMNMRRRVTTVR